MAKSRSKGKVIFRCPACNRFRHRKLRHGKCAGIYRGKPFGCEANIKGQKNVVWFYYVWVNSERTYHHVGPHPTSEPAERALAKANADITAGRYLNDRDSITFGKLAEIYLNDYASEKRGEGLKEDTRMLNKDILPYLKDMLLSEIKQLHVSEALQHILKRKHGKYGGKITYNRTRALAHRIFKVGNSRGFCEHNPVTGIDRQSTMPTASKRGEQPKKRVLSDDEIRTVWNLLDTAPSITEMAKAIKILLCTGQRPVEVVEMRSDALNWQEKYWNNPAEKTRGPDNPHKVPLNRLAFEILFSLPKDRDYLFQSRLRKDEPLRRESLSQWLKDNDALAEIKFTPHDLRRTVRTNLAKLGFSKDIARQVLGHQVEGIDQVYDHYDYDPEKRAALDAWGERLEAILNQPEKAERQ